MSAENNTVTTKKRHSFPKGVSGNPGGRPKQTPEQKDALEAIRGLTPRAVEVMREILDSPRSGEVAKLRVAEIVLDRTYGKATAQVMLTSGSFDALDAAFEALKDADTE